MALALVLVFGILRIRGQDPEIIGLGAFPPVRVLFAEAVRLVPWFGLAWILGGVVGVALFGQPQTSIAVQEHGSIA